MCVCVCARMKSIVAVEFAEVPLFKGFAEFLQSDIAKTTDGVIISSTHSTHFELGRGPAWPSRNLVMSCSAIWGVRWSELISPL